MAEALDAFQGNDRNERAHMQARRRGVETDVRGDLLACEKLARAFRGLGDLPAPFEFVKESTHQGVSTVLYLRRGIRRVSGAIQILEAP
jgi:hypothetical protein